MQNVFITQVSLQLVRVEQRKLGADVAEMKRTITKSQKRVDSIEKDMRQVKGWVEELRRLTPPTEGERFVAAAKPGASGDVELRPQVAALLGILYSAKFEKGSWGVRR